VVRRQGGKRRGGVEASGVDERSLKWERRFEIPMLVVAFLVIPVLILQESDVEGTWRTIADVGNWLIWLAFAFEAAVMLYVVPNRWAWIRDNPFSLPIVILTPPFAPPSLQAARVFRLLRLLRLGRSFRLIRRFFSPTGLKWAALVTGFVVLGGAAAFEAVEEDQGLSLWDGLWWATTTVTTVGYGDISPTTDEGRLIAIAIMLVGIGFVAMLTAAMAQLFVARAVEEEVEPREDAMLTELRGIQERLERLEER
jgi:voltage-gated potassium channel